MFGGRVYERDNVFAGLALWFRFAAFRHEQSAKGAGFLDVFGRWDASLAFVMGGAILVTLIAFRGSRSAKPLCAPAFQEPATTRIDRRLLAGSALFGIGWGLAGICPGPALVLAGMLRAEMLWFGGAILAGMWLFRLQKRP